MKLVVPILQSDQPNANGDVFTREALQQAADYLRDTGTIRFTDDTGTRQVSLLEARVSHRGLEVTIEVDKFSEANHLMKLIQNGQTHISMGCNVATILPKD